VTLLTNAMHASGDLTRVLRIAATQAKADRRLKRDRRQEMLSYMVVVYVSFFVFLFIIAIINVVLMGNITETTTVANATSGGGAQNVPAVAGAGKVGSINTDAYKLIFVHTGVIQGAVSGFVAGQLSTGDLRDGAKHATIMMAVAYAAFLLFLG